MNLKIKILKTENVTSDYVNWFKNDLVKKYSDNQYRDFSIKGQCEYVNSCLLDPNIDLYGIFDGRKHIGNILINGILTFHKRAEISYVVGNTSYWGIGVGSFAVSEMVILAKKKYNLHKLYAGIAEDNIGSKRILEKNNFKLEGKRLDHLFYNGRYSNQLDYGLILNL